MAALGIRIIYLCISALMTVPIFFNLYSHDTTRAEEKQAPGYSQPRKILENISEDNEPNELTTIFPNNTNSSHTTLDITKGIKTEILYKRGFYQNQPKICPEKGKDTKLLILITSAPPNENARNDIRNTWGKFALSKNVSVGFLLAYTPNKTIEKSIKNEQHLHGDIIQGKSIDSYDNLTLKTISALEWTKTYCHQAQFVLKTDDDVFINVERLIAYISELNPKVDAIYGRLAKNWKPIRVRKSKYFTSFEQYKPEVFPIFTTGPAYLLPVRICQRLFDSALTKIYFKLEDVFTTGLVAESIGIKRHLAPEFLNKRITFTPCNIKRHISLHPLKPKEQPKLWKMLQTQATCRS